MGRNKADDKPSDKPRTNGEVEKGDDATAPVDPNLQAKLTARTTDSFDDETVIPPHPAPSSRDPGALAGATVSDDDLSYERSTERAPPRGRTDTVSMLTSLGRPPEMPTSSAPPPLALGEVEDPTHMPGPRDIPGGEPDVRAPAPGRVPPGDSRSLRRGPGGAGLAAQFALIYRIGTYVISRSGAVGTRGQWRVVEYPTSSSASHSYAKECSRFAAEGFADYRD